MDRVKLERLYKERGLEDWNLKSEEDLYEIHGIKLGQIKGYRELNEAEKLVFRDFIINFYNAHSIDFRDMIPVKVFIALEKTYAVNTDSINNLPVRRELINIKTKEIEELWQYEKFIGKEARLKTIDKYMRFEYIQNGVSIWLHVNKGDSWY